jgi:tetratricopeptide (TPR) repeat protein
MIESVAFYEKALALEPQNLSLQKRYAAILFKKGDRAKALAVLEQLAGDRRLSVDPANLDMLEEIAAKYLEIGETERAIALLRSILRLKKNDAKTWNDLGSVYFKKRDMAQARECYEQGLAADPGFALSYCNLGSLALTSFVQKKDRAALGKALALFDQAIARDSTLALAYNGRAAAYRFGGRPIEALQDWKKALELNPGLSDAYFNIGITYLESGEKAQALEYFKLCQEKNSAKLSPADKKRLERLLAEAR